MIPQAKKSNPLVSIMRQPKIYIKIPSNGAYWPKGSLQLSETGEYPVYSMTAKDELTLKIPDALLNGQAIVDVIQNCMPNIKDAWKCPNIDLDVILIAIRIATYGHNMNVPVKAGDNDLEYSVDLRLIMNNLYEQITWDETVEISPELTIFVRPINYKQMTDSALQTFETQRILRLANNENISEEEKLEQFRKSFQKLNNVSVGMINRCVFRVDSVSGSTDIEEYVQEYMESVDRDIFERVKDHISNLKEKNTVKPLVINVTEEMRAAGYTGDTLEIPLVFDASTFFV